MGVGDTYFWYFFTLILLTLGTVSVFFTRSHPDITNYMAHGIGTLGCLAAVLCAILALTGDAGRMVFALGPPFGDVSVNIDKLSAYFLLVVGLVGGASAIYAVGYSVEYYGHRLALMAGLFNAFLLSMVLVLTVSHVLAFFAAWELMAIVSFPYRRHAQ